MAMLGRVAMLFAAIVLLLRFSLVLGNLECEDLITDECAFAVSSSGARCVLEKSTLFNGEIRPTCQTSLIMAERPEEWIESEECIQGCGLERESYGLSTDALMETGFADKLCSAECQNNCHNIIDLYLKLAAGEGVYLPRLCTERKSKARRLIADPVQVAQYGTEGGRGVRAGGAGVWSSTHVTDNDNDQTLQTQQQPAEPWDSAAALVSYGPAPSPAPVTTVTTAAAGASTKIKRNKKLALTSASPPPPLPAAAPAPAPGLLSLPAAVYGASTVTIDNEYFDDQEY